MVYFGIGIVKKCFVIFVQENDNYEVVLDLDFVFIRVVFCDNLFKYYLDSWMSMFIEVIQILMVKGVDFEYNCFFILQVRFYFNY